MKHRYLPFGYKLEQGKIVRHPQEAKAVMQIFDLYKIGMGFTSITHQLNENATPYHPGRPWNKHMVKRILENRRYLGEQGYPAIIGDADFDFAAKLKAEKTSQQAKASGEAYQINSLSPDALSAHCKGLSDDQRHQPCAGAFPRPRASPIPDLCLRR